MIDLIKVGRRAVLLTGLLAFLSGQIPSGYYDNASGLDDNALKSALNNIIDGHTEFPYTSSGTDTWDILKISDRDPNNSSNVITVYTQYSMNAALEYDGGDGWNREHVWAKSHGDFGTSTGTGTDIHNLKPADVSINSAKSNLDFAGGGTVVTDNSPPSGYSGTTSSKSTSNSWEPPDGVKGDVARIMFYMETRYEGENGEVDLELVNTYYTGNNEATHGILDTLYAWHLRDPVDSFETNRNDVIYSYQANRNPFIDHPEYANYIWGGESPSSIANPTTVSTTANSSSEIGLTWTDNSNSNNVLLAWNSANTFGTPTNGSTYAAENSITGGGTVLQYSGTDSYTHSSLTSNTAYYYKVWSYDGSSYSSGVMANATTSASGTQTLTYGWEDGGTNMGTSGNVSASTAISTSEKNSGSNGYNLIESPLSGTPQIYVAYITGLSANDQVTASVYIKGETSGSDQAKGRLWGHYTDGTGAVASYNASASGPSGYIGNEGTWEQGSHTWTIGSGKTDLVIQVRIYSYSNADNIWIDDLSVTAPSSAKITFPGHAHIYKAGFHLLSSPVAGTYVDDLLSNAWTQGMTGGDITGGSANVWTYGSGSFSAISNISSLSLSAGNGVLTYLYADKDYDGDSDLPFSLSVTSGTINTGSVAALSGLANGDWALLGNPYMESVDWDDLTTSGLTGTVYVYDNNKSGGAGYIEWNGTAGSLTGGIIAPYQGFWVKGSGGSGSLTFETADQENIGGHFYKEKTGQFMSFKVEGESFMDESFISFQKDASPSIDRFDALKLLPLDKTDRLVSIQYSDSLALSINNVPIENAIPLSYPFDIMYLRAGKKGYTPIEGEAVLSWNITHLPQGVTVRLKDNHSGVSFILKEEETYSFQTSLKNAFDTQNNGRVLVYPKSGESRFMVTLVYNSLGTERASSIPPMGFTLHPVYPNPFNPATRILFDIYESSEVNIMIYDLAGKRVDTLQKGYLGMGHYSYFWKPVNLSSGIYFLYFEANGHRIHQKLTLIK